MRNSNLPCELTHSVNVITMVAAPEMFLQLTSRSYKLAATLLPRTVYVAPWTLILQVHFHGAPGQGVVTVRVVRTHHCQFVQNSTH